MLCCGLGAQGTDGLPEWFALQGDGKRMGKPAAVSISRSKFPKKLTGPLPANKGAQP